MPEPIRIRRALISVYDKTGIVDFARALHDEFGIEIISTGGTAKTLTDAGIPVTLVEDITGFPELLGGRVKTLHPKIFAAILADRDDPEHMRQLKEQGTEPIDMVVVNLYPFEETVARPECTFEEALEMIDIGGVCLLRAAAKNHKHVLVLHDREDWERVLLWLREDALTEQGWHGVRRDYATGAFAAVSLYEAQIARWLSDGCVRAVHMRILDQLRYGENPGQTSWLSVLAGTPAPEPRRGAPVQTWQPRPLPWADFALRTGPLGSDVRMSFNNYADASAALELCAELTRVSQLGSAKLCFAPAEPEGRRFRPVRDEQTSRRKLPHWQHAGATYWITFRSIAGPLNDAERDIVLAALRHCDGQRLDLHAAVVMPNHVHALLTPRATESGAENLSSLLQSIKSYSGREISQRRGGVGQIWDRESFDRWIRSPEDLKEKWRYIAENPVKEGLAPAPEHYPWWYAVDLFGEGTGDPINGATPLPPILEEADAGADRGTRAPEGTKLDKAELDKAELCPPRVVCFIKHTNACGVGIAHDPIEAYRRAYLGDPKAAMGGILAVNFNVDAAFTEAVMESLQRWGKDAGAGAFFVEVWLAPSFEEAAVKLIRTKKTWGERVRLLDVSFMDAMPDPDELEYKSIAGGMLAQTRDLVGLNEDQWKVVTKRQPTEQEMGDLRLAWLIAKYTKSNAVSICKDGMLIGNGAGQMSRVMSCRIATWLAKDNGHAERLREAAAASDGFFPFRDGPDLLADAGVSAIIQPGGSKHDQVVIDACNERGVAMIFTGTRHFKH